MVVQEKVTERPTESPLPCDLEALRAAFVAQLKPRPTKDSVFLDNILSRVFNVRELRRMAITAKLIPPPQHSDAHLVDIGGTVFWMPLYRMLGYKRISVVGRGGGGFFDCFDVSSDDSRFVIENLDADAELDRYPIETGGTNCVVCLEVLEHFAGDPMHFISETNRVLAMGGRLCLTTPNVLFYDNIVKILIGEHPFSWSVFTNSYADRHNREYTPFEVRRLLECGGFSVEHLTTANLVSPNWKRRTLGYATSLPGALSRRVPLEMRHESILVRAAKTGLVSERFPEFLYILYGHSEVHVNLRTSRGS